VEKAKMMKQLFDTLMCSKGTGYKHQLAVSSFQLLEQKTYSRKSG
jgi:hypothetical protein